MATIISRFELRSEVDKSCSFAEFGRTKDGEYFTRYFYSSMPEPVIHYFGTCRDPYVASRHDYSCKVDVLLSTLK